MFNFNGYSNHYRLVKHYSLIFSVYNILQVQPLQQLDI